MKIRASQRFAVDRDTKDLCFSEHHTRKGHLRSQAIMRMLIGYVMPGELPYRTINVLSGLDLDQVCALRQALRLCWHMHSTGTDEFDDMALSLLFKSNDGLHTAFDLWFDRRQLDVLIGCWSCRFDEGEGAVRLPWPVFGRRRDDYRAWFPFTVEWECLDQFERCALSQLLGGGRLRGWELQHIAIEVGKQTAAHAWRKPHEVPDDGNVTDEY
ncbi:hypothetical protein JKP88DRAFT_251664 [Tribonema minus]|uniref:Uncharacterized protein n=1 Tax=Tribonema minus TaxID=303371 RepID=A0A836CLV2_9STRA|nr:hypothetical protein JKP88DRAFT_251664 [Tribonema minus]